MKVAISGLLLLVVLAAVANAQVQGTLSHPQSTRSVDFYCQLPLHSVPGNPHQG